MTGKKIAILSIYYHNWNFGALLQSYALNRVLRSMGFEAEHIRFCYAEPAPEKSPLPKRIRTILTRHRISAHFLERFFCLKEREMKNRRNFYSFHDKEIRGSLCCCDAVTVSGLNRKYDIFITGSDQVWNPQFWSDRLLRVFGLTFADRKKRTISYGASIGSEKAAKGKEELYRDIMEAIDCISVREDSAKDYLQPLTAKKIQVVLDPTLLLKADQWDDVMVKRQVQGKYIFSYFLEEKYPHTDQVLSFSNIMNLPMYCVSKIKNLYTRPGLDFQIYDAGPKEFLSYIKNAECIITNSFHGMVFSIIFHKNFWVINRYRDHEQDEANHRITDLLSRLDLTNRLLKDGEVPELEKLQENIDFSLVEEKLLGLQKESMEWLRSALGISPEFG